MKHDDESPNLRERLGSAALGMMAGLLLGALAWGGWACTHATAPSAARFVFGGAGVGAALGFVSMRTSLGLLSALAHVFGGVAVAANLERRGDLSGRASFPEPRDPATATWRRWLLWACVALGIAAWLALRVRVR